MDNDQLKIKIEHYPPKVGMMSCVGIMSNNYPLSFGNYCSILDGPYLVNCWAENLEEWVKRNPECEKIEITTITHLGKTIGLVTDKRLEGWVNQRLCVTGNGWPSTLVAQKCSEITGIPYEGH